MSEPEGPGRLPANELARIYEHLEGETAAALERAVGSRGSGALIGQLAENVAALTKLGSDAMDLLLRNLRLAGRRDIVRLAGQLARTEDKLERVLQEVELLRDQLAERSTSGLEAEPPPQPKVRANGRVTARAPRVKR